MSPGRVLLICGEYPPVLGGISDYSRLLARGVAARGWEVEVLTTALPDHPRSAVDDGVRVERGMDGWRLRDLPAALRAAERAGDGVVVHIQYPAVAFRRSRTRGTTSGLPNERQQQVRIIAGGPS